jgi:hypothetical protein
VGFPHVLVVLSQGARCQSWGSSSFRVPRAPNGITCEVPSQTVRPAEGPA